MEALAWIASTWFTGMGITFLISLMGFWFDDLPLSEIAFRVVAWPLFLGILLLAGARQSWRRHTR